MPQNRVAEVDCPCSDCKARVNARMLLESCPPNVRRIEKKSRSETVSEKENINFNNKMGANDSNQSQAENDYQHDPYIIEHITEAQDKKGNFKEEENEVEIYKDEPPPDSLHRMEYSAKDLNRPLKYTSDFENYKELVDYGDEKMETQSLYRSQYQPQYIRRPDYATFKDNLQSHGDMLKESMYQSQFRPCNVTRPISVSHPDNIKTMEGQMLKESVYQSQFQGKPARRPANLTREDNLKPAEGFMLKESMYRSQYQNMSAERPQSASHPDNLKSFDGDMLKESLYRSQFNVKTVSRPAYTVQEDNLKTGEGMMEKETMYSSHYQTKTIRRPKVNQQKDNLRCGSACFVKSSAKQSYF